MIDADLYVMYGSTLPFQQVGMNFPNPIPAPVTGNLLIFDKEQRLLVIQCGTPLGAVHFHSEILETEPEVDGTDWDEMQEVSVEFDSGDVRLRDLEADQDLLPISLVPQAGRYRARLYAVGRDSGVELQEPGEDLVERYFLQVWPEERHNPDSQTVRFDR